MSSSTKESNIDAVGEIKKGYRFSVVHSDGYVANEIVSHIVERVTETNRNAGRGADSYIAYGKLIQHFVVCESAAVYTPSEIFSK